jgi:putative ABC transport system permease protein
MNTMLFSIKERINEIGIRKAIGAFNNDILSQFIFEGFVYGLLSAIIGICVSISIMSQVVILWGEEIFGRTTRIIISKEAVLLSLAAAILVSVLASIIPAIYASRIKVSQALKFE